MDQTDIGNGILESALEADLRQNASYALVMYGTLVLPSQLAK